MMKPGRLIRTAVLLLAAAALAQELGKPEAERTWHGRVLGVPYDFRWPTWQRIRDAYWNPGDPRILTDRVVGVGWSVNIAQLIPRLREAYVTLSDR
ncbi:MAG: hypothetical protein E6J01_08940 [Chloroflexi bacterium]|nr:MAG: hypothetical protein E6J01_08940 [Chloroflexota bacterium]